MLLHRFEAEGLAAYSYAVGCPAAARVAIVDPSRDIDVYTAFADERGLEITDVLETHIHADYASGARELADRTGARLHLSAYDECETFEVSFDHQELGEGETIEIGSVVIEALHTPGHTPEHLAFLVYDGARSRDVPEILLSGDFLFVGSIGRPDLLGEEEQQELVHRLHDSVREKLAGLPDGLEIHPAHGAGSMCGSAIGGRPYSTLGFERVANPYLDPGLSREAFAEKVLSSLPPFPPYYRRMKRINSEGPRLLHGLPGTAPVEIDRFAELVEQDHVVIDLRDQLSFGRGHIPGSFGIGLGPNLSTWAAWVVPYDVPILLVPGDSGPVDRAVRALVRVGLDDVRGFLAGGMEAWNESGREIAMLPQIDPRTLHERLQTGERIGVLDVRTDEEWKAGHIEGATHVMGGHLESRLDEVPAERPLAVVCGSGYRSTVAASVLERAGFEGVVNMTGGMGAWKAAQLPTVRPELAAEVA